MKIIGYVGSEGDCIVIEKPTDLYPALDWIQNRMIELGEKEDGYSEADECADFISNLMQQAEKNGYGTHDDIENIQWHS